MTARQEFIEDVVNEAYSRFLEGNAPKNIAIFTEEYGAKNKWMLDSTDKQFNKAVAEITKKFNAKVAAKKDRWSWKNGNN